jgi:hypothetical protein
MEDRTGIGTQHDDCNDPNAPSRKPSKVSLPDRVNCNGVD